MKDQSQQLDPIPLKAIETMAGIFQPQMEPVYRANNRYHALRHAAQLVGNVYDLTMQEILIKEKMATDMELLTTMAEYSNCRVRHVKLDNQWWKKDHGPLLVFYGNEREPCALLEQNKGEYDLINPQREVNQHTPLASCYSHIQSDAYMFYPQLPNKVLSVWDLAKFTMLGMRRYFWKFIGVQLIIMFLGMANPILSGRLMEDVLPNRSYQLFWTFLCVFLMTSVVNLVFGLYSSFVTMHVSYRVNINLQAALWDRVFRFPLKFFRKFMVGDLSSRISGVDSIAQIVSTTTITTFFSSILFLPSLIIMLTYAPLLSLVTIGSILITMPMSLGVMVPKLYYTRVNLRLSGIVSAFMNQLIRSIPKIRVNHKEEVVFGRWAALRARMIKMQYRAAMIGLRMSVLQTFYSTAITGVVFFIVILENGKISLGDYITFTAASGQFTSAIFGLFSVVFSSIAIVPTYQRSSPILKEVPIDESVGVEMPRLTGRIEMKNIWFRFQPEEYLNTDPNSNEEFIKPPPEQVHWVLQKINFIAEQGDHIAFVGESGVGKSTLMRLLLGLERPDKGQTLYDNVDILTINQHIRRQFGVLLQDSKLNAGSIYENVVNRDQYGMDYAREMLELVGFLDEVEAMPMGLNTLLAEDGRNLSTGQRQRLLIARALSQKPRILFLDEATSALDNRVQAHIIRSLNKMNITTLTVAHRLSTIRYANYIYLLHKGRIVQHGTFDEMYNLGSGYFYEMCRRQMI